MFTLSTFYKSSEWENLIRVIKLERPMICAECGQDIIAKYDCICHHIVELTEANVNDYNVSLNKDNIALLHHKCHNKIHSRFGCEGAKKVYLVYGSPCSGKSTYVNACATKDDLILDIDKIWECLSVCDKYDKPNRIKANVFGVRDTILEQIKMRVGKWRNAYIVGGYPLASDRERLCNLLGAEEIFVDTDKDTCLNRAKNKEWVKYIDEWFSDYTPPTS